MADREADNPKGDLNLRAVIILAGGRSSRFGRDKTFVDFSGKPLIAHMVERLQDLGDECIVSIGRNHRIEAYRRILPTNTRIIQDTVNFQGPLAGFVSGLEECKSNLCFLTACDMPFVERKVVEHLFEQVANHSAAIPRWRDGRVEPLHAVYDCKYARRAARQTVQDEATSMIGLIDHIANVRFVSVEEEIAPLNSKLDTFRNLNTPRDMDED